MHLQFSPQHTISREPGRFTIESQSAKLRLRSLSSASEKSLSLLIEGVDEDVLTDVVLEHEGAHGLYKLYQHLELFKQHGLLSYTVCSSGKPLLTLVPEHPSFRFRTEEFDESKPFVLSRFCYFRDGAYETPLCPAKVIVHELDLSFLPCRKLLWHAHMLAGPEEENSALASWEFHDLLFHTRSREGRHSKPYGATFSLDIKHPPVCKTPMSGEKISLFRPDLEMLRQNDRSFTAVLEQRESKRESKGSLTVQQLGEFLFRAARIKETKDFGTYFGSKRPSPSGGGMHPLEIYVVVRHCEGLAPGLYHYSPDSHTLHKLSSEHDSPQAEVLFVITARFQRTSWKYSSIAYATILKDAGALMQTLYLVATAMNLTPCAIGGGDADRFSSLIGSNYYEESPVAEFMLNS